MKIYYLRAFLITFLISLAAPAVAESSSHDDIIALRQALSELRNDYENRIKDLERRLTLAEAKTETTLEIAEEAALAPVVTSRSANDFNPAIGLVLVGTVGTRNNDDDYTVPGFSLPDEAGPVNDGLSLGESELNLNANIDDKFFGNLTLAVAADGAETEVELEEAYIQSLFLPGGLNLTAGRFFSGVGYLNAFHAHSDDFTDRPLAYEVFMGGQYKDDGLRLSWTLPTSRFIELGAELFRGESFPAAGAAHDGTGSWTLFAATGGDLGVSSSWKAGLGYIHASVIDRPVDPNDDNAEQFSGDSRLTNLNFVWKWSPLGNSVSQNFKLQGEYFSRREAGELNANPYSGNQSGWYLQGTWQFKRQWIAGYRHGSARADNQLILPAPLTSSLSTRDLGAIDRDSLILSWVNSEFSRIRLQYNNSTGLDNDSRWVLQYIVSLGAHGAHQF
jgi:hypothetical protein